MAAPAPNEHTPVSTKIEEMLTEARVVLPGAQALFGFQLTVTLTQAFEQLPHSSQLLHAAALLLVALAIILLMAPAAFHRIAFAGEDTEAFHRLGSGFIIAATVPLAGGIAADVYVALTKITQHTAAAIAAAAFAAAVMAGLWYVHPYLLRRKHAPGPAGQPDLVGPS
jgi:Family of unknown function (DUF6328)